MYVDRDVSMLSGAFFFVLFLFICVANLRGKFIVRVCVSCLRRVFLLCFCLEVVLGFAL